MATGKHHCERNLGPGACHVSALFAASVTSVCLSPLSLGMRQGILRLQNHFYPGKPLANSAALLALPCPLLQEGSMRAVWSA